MFKPILVLFACGAAGWAEVHELTLKQAVETALKQNPEIAMARLEEQKAVERVRIAKDPFTPKVAVGSGLAYSSGFPMSIEGSAPSIVQARASQFIFNRQQSYAAAQAREEARGFSIAAGATADDVAFRAASLFLDAERLRRISENARKQIESQEKVIEGTRFRIREGRQLPIDEKRAALNLALARQALQNFEANAEFAERSLAVLLGRGSGDRIVAVAEERSAPPLPDSEDAAAELAVKFNKDLRRLESKLIAAGLDIRSQQAARLPRIDLVAQYGLFAKFNNYEDFFQRFQRHNGQLGISFQLPLSAGPGVSAQTAQAAAEAARLRTEMKARRDRIALDARQSWQKLQSALTAVDVARLDLDLAREQISVNLALNQEGRATLAQVEQARYAENEKWIAFYEAQYGVERARWELLHQTGDLLAALR